MKKIYQKKDAHSNMSSMRLTVGEKSKTIVFENKRKNGSLQYETSDEKVQEAIENTENFADGRIALIEGTAGTKTVKVAAPAKTTEEGTGTDLTVIEDVTDYQQAKEVLRSEPYSVAHQALGTPEKIMAKAAELGVSFPNLKA